MVDEFEMFWKPIEAAFGQIDPKLRVIINQCGLAYFFYFKAITDADFPKLVSEIEDHISSLKEDSEQLTEIQKIWPDIAADGFRLKFSMIVGIQAIHKKIRATDYQNFAALQCFQKPMEFWSASPYPVVKNSQITIEHIQPPASKQMQIFVKVNQKSIILWVEPSDTIRDVISKLHIKQGLPKGLNYRLTSPSRVSLEHNHTLESYNIHEEATLFLKPMWISFDEAAKSKLA